MKKSALLCKGRLLLISCAIALALLLLVTAFAAETVDEKMARVLTYDGLSARMDENGGIRSVYLVDQSAVASLEKEGYTVAYGAIMGFASYLGTPCNTTRSLCVTGDVTGGYRAANPHSAAVVIYVTGNPSYASRLYLDEAHSSFAYTTLYADAVAEKYDTELVYAGFVAVTDKSGNQTVVYDYAEEENFGKEGAVYGAATSFCELSDYLLNRCEITIKTYRYHQNETLRRVLTLCGKEIRVPTPPILLKDLVGEVSLSKADPARYVAAARNAYRTEAYADYKTSVISNYKTNLLSLNDIPTPVRLSWESNEEGARYEVILATDPDFTENVRTQASLAHSAAIYNLLTNTTYYFKLKVTTADGDTYETEAHTFKTADTVRWISVDGVRNVRDLGGWNGLNQGLIYRGSELNLVGTHGLQITEAGVAVMAGQLGIKTDLDFRAATQNGAYGTSSPIGESATWINAPIAAFLPAFGASYIPAMRVFIDYDNYPVYMHCWGGADRTGTAAFMIEGLCGVSEEDLAIDLELTSFSKFGYRYRYDNTTYVYASLVARIKEFYGATLQEKFETCFREIYGFSEAEICNIQAINTQNGGVYDFAEGENGDVFISAETGYTFDFRFVMRNSKSVTSVTVDGTSLDFSFDKENSRLTVNAEALAARSFLAGIGTVTFDDGATLRFYIENEAAKSLCMAVRLGNFEPMITDGISQVVGNTLMLSPQSSYELPAAQALALYHGGYEGVSFSATAGTIVTVYDAMGVPISSEELSENKTVFIAFTKNRVVLATNSRWSMVDGFEMKYFPWLYE